MQLIPHAYDEPRLPLRQAFVHEDGHGFPFCNLLISTDCWTSTENPFHNHRKLLYHNLFALMQEP